MQHLESYHNDIDGMIEAGSELARYDLPLNGWSFV